MRGLAGNLSDLTLASSRYDILLCSETLHGLRYASRVGVAGSRIWSPCLVPEQDAWGPRDKWWSTPHKWWSTPQKWWSTLKSAVFGLSSSLPPLVGGGGLQVCESVGKADLLSNHFDGKQSRESVDLLCTCHPSPRLTSFAFRSSGVRRLLLDLDPYGGSDQMGMFPLFLKRTVDVLAPRLIAVFRRLVRLGSFPVCWRQANVTPIQNGPPSSSVANYRPISITSVLSKVFEHLVSVRLG